MERTEGNGRNGAGILTNGRCRDSLFSAPFTRDAAPTENSWLDKDCINPMHPVETIEPKFAGASGIEMPLLVRSGGLCRERFAD